MSERPPLGLEDLINKSDVTLPKSPSKFKALSFDDVMNEPPKEWLVDRLIGKGEQCMIVGDGKAGKTLVVFDLIASLARGTELFAGIFQVEGPVPVVYCTAEGKRGLPNRLKALQSKFNLDRTERERIKLLKEIPNIWKHDEPGGIEEFVQTFKDEFGDWLRGGILILDTWARATGGADENTSKDTTAILDAMSYAQQELGCTVIPIHHTNKQGGIRGSTNIQAGFDNVIEIKRQEGGIRTLSCQIAKDAEDVPDIRFEIQSHEWIAPDGTIHQGGYIEWVGKIERPVKVKEDEQAARKARLIETLRTVALGEKEAKTANQVYLALGETPSLPTVRKDLQKLMTERPDDFETVNKPVIERGGKEGAEHVHYFAKGVG